MKGRPSCLLPDFFKGEYAMKKASICLLILLTITLLCSISAQSEAISDIQYLTVLIDDVHYTLGSSTPQDFVRHGWTYSIESDGTFSFAAPDEEGYFYVTTQTPADPASPIMSVNLMWADGVRSSYAGFSSEDADDPDEFWDYLTNTYGATVNDEGHLTATIPVANGRLVYVETADVRVYLELTVGQVEAYGQIIRCPEQNFSTLTYPAFTWDYHPDQGVTIYPGQKDQLPYVTMSIIESPDFNAEHYLTQVFTARMKETYGSQLFAVGEYHTIPIAGTTLYGQLYGYQSGGQRLFCYVVIDRHRDHSVRYEARFSEADQTNAFGTIGISALFCRRDPYYYDTQSPDRSEQLELLACPAQAFSTRTEPGTPWKYDPQTGLTIYAQNEGYIPNVNVFRSEDLYVDTVELIEEMVTPNIQQLYGEDLLSAELYERYPIAGRDMAIGLYRYRLQDQIIEMVRAYENRDGHTVMYVAKYILGEGEKTLALLETAARYYQSGTTAAASQTVSPAPGIPEGLQRVAYPEQEFSILMDPSYTWTKDVRNGITIYTQHEGSIPFVTVFRSEDWLVDAADYIHEQYTPHMQSQYGENLISHEEFREYTLGGRIMPAAIYSYNLQGYTIEMIRAYDTQAGHTVIFTAKYVQGQGDATLKALDTAARYYQPDASYTD